jgi:hypothetical protein
VEKSGRVSLRVGPRSTRKVPAAGEGLPEMVSAIGPIDYPDSYETPVRFVQYVTTGYRDPLAPTDQSKVEWFCFTCSFRPWADTGDARVVNVTVKRRGSRPVVVRAVKRGDRWVTKRRLRSGERAWIAAGGVRDHFGNVNGVASAVVKR